MDSNKYTRKWKISRQNLPRVIALLMICLLFSGSTSAVPAFASETAESDTALDDNRYSTLFEDIRLGVEPEPERVLADPEKILSEELTVGESFPDPSTAMGQIYTYITEDIGLNRAVAFGILAHMRRESTFLPTAYNPAGYYGICQWGGNRYTNLIQWCSNNGYDYTTIDGQVRFMESELNGPYAKVFESLKECENSAQGAYDAAYIFGMRYEVSGQSLAKSAGRAAMEMFNYASPEN